MNLNDPIPDYYYTRNEDDYYNDNENLDIDSAYDFFHVDDEIEKVEKQIDNLIDKAKDEKQN